MSVGSCHCLQTLLIVLLQVTPSELPCIFW